MCLLTECLESRSAMQSSNHRLTEALGKWPLQHQEALESYLQWWDFVWIEAAAWHVIPNFLTSKWEQEVSCHHRLGLHNTGTMRHKTRNCSDCDSAGLFSWPGQKWGPQRLRHSLCSPPVEALTTLHSKDTIVALFPYTRFLVSFGHD